MKKLKSLLLQLLTSLSICDLTQAFVANPGPHSILSLSNRVHLPGYLSSWSLLSSLNDSGLVAVQVWRPIARIGLDTDSNHWLLYQLIGVTPSRNISTASTHPDLDIDDYILVEKGDVLGIFYTHSLEVLCNTSLDDSVRFYEGEYNQPVGGVGSYAHFLPLYSSTIPSSCGISNLKGTVQYQACEIVEIVQGDASNASFRDTLSFAKPCWIFKGHGNDSLQISIQSCSLGKELILNQGESSTDPEVATTCDGEKDILYGTVRTTSALYLAFNRTRRLLQVPFNVSFVISPDSLAGCHRVVINSTSKTLPVESKNECWEMTTTGTGRLIVSLDISAYHRGYGESGSCLKYVLKLRDGISSTSPLLWLTCEPFAWLMTSGPQLHIRLTNLTGYRISGSITIKSARRDYEQCTEYSVWEGEETIITSPGYPKPYLPYVTDCWVARSHLPGGRLLLTVLDSDLEPHDSCTSDYVEVRDGGRSKGEPLLRRWCGLTVPEQMLSSSSSLFILFKSNRETNHKGFKLSIRLIHTRMCSLYYPQNHRNLLVGVPSEDLLIRVWNNEAGHCYVISSGKSQHRIQVDIRRKRSQNMHFCQCIEIKNGNSPAAPSLYQTCKEGTWQTNQDLSLESSGESLYLEYAVLGNMSCPPINVYYHILEPPPMTTTTGDGSSELITQFVSVWPGELTNTSSHIPTQHEPTTTLDNQTGDMENTETTTSQQELVTPVPQMHVTHHLTLAITLTVFVVAGLFALAFVVIFVYVRQKTKTQQHNQTESTGVCRYDGTNCVLESHAHNAHRSVTFSDQQSEIVHDYYDYHSRDKSGGYINQLYDQFHIKDGTKKEIGC